MARRVTLTDKEQTLRSLLLDVSEYIHHDKNLQKPELRFTGGWVRDKLMGSDSKDIDIGIDCMTGEKYALLMKEFMDDPTRSAKYGDEVVRKISKIAANPEKSKHLETARTVILGLEVDLVNLRKETYADDSRNPQIESATPEEDAFRRDSTVNALFYNLQTDGVEDFTGLGLQDLESKLIRTPLEPYQTFKDDPLRVLRTIRFASRLGFNIDPTTLDCMKVHEIQAALRAKISRERVGEEVGKMLRGASPLMALRLIDEQSLYEAVFADPNDPTTVPEGLASWSRAYYYLDKLQCSDGENKKSEIKKFLLQHPGASYNAWILAAMVPWKTMYVPQGTDQKPKPPVPAAAVAAREGLRIENKTMTLIKHAVDNHAEILAIADSISAGGREIGSSTKRKQDSYSRESLGVAMRRWGPDWHSSVLYAILLDIMIEGEEVVESKYTSLLRELERLELLGVSELKPLLNGSELSKALGRKPGPWMSLALNQLIEWQLRNPESSDTSLAIKDLKERLGE